MAIQIIIDGYDLTSCYKPGSATITDLPNGETGKANLILEGPRIPDPPSAPLVHNPTFPAAVTATMPDPADEVNLVRFRPRSGTLLTIRDDRDPDGVNIFVGVVLRKPEDTPAIDDDDNYHFVYNIAAATAGQTLDGHFVTDIWDSKRTGFIFKDVITRYAPDFDSSEIAVTGPNAGRERRPVYLAERKPVRSVLDELAQTEGWTWYIEETEPTSLTNTKKVKLGPPNVLRESYRFTDDNLDNIVSKLPTIDKGDLTQVRNVIYYNYFCEYDTKYKGSGASNNALNYTRGLARIAQGDPNIQPLGEANWASYIKPGAVFYIPGSNYRYTVAQVFTNGNITLNTPVLDATGDVPYVFSNVPATVKLKDPVSIDILKKLYQNGDNGEREFQVSVNQLMTFEQALHEARAQLNDRANPMVRMSLRTNTHLLRQYNDWVDGIDGITGTKVHPKAGKGVEFNLVKRDLIGVFTQKQVGWKDTGVLDADGRQLWDLTLDFSDRLFALTTIFRKLIDGQLNGFTNVSQQVIFDVVDINETQTIRVGPATDEVKITGTDVTDYPMADANTLEVSEALDFIGMRNNPQFKYGDPNTWYGFSSYAASQLTPEVIGADDLAVTENLDGLVVDQPGTNSRYGMDQYGTATYGLIKLPPDVAGTDTTELTENLTNLVAEPLPSRWGAGTYGTSTYQAYRVPQVSGDETVGLDEEEQITVGAVGNQYGRGSYDQSTYVENALPEMTGGETAALEETIDELSLGNASANQYGRATYGDAWYIEPPVAGTETVGIGEAMDLLAAAPFSGSVYGTAAYGRASYLTIKAPDVTVTETVTLGETVDQLTAGPINHRYGRATYDVSSYQPQENDVTVSETLQITETPNITKQLYTDALYGAAAYGQSSYLGTPIPEVTGTDTMGLGESVDSLAKALPVTVYGSAKYGRTHYLDRTPNVTGSESMGISGNLDLLSLVVTPATYGTGKYGRSSYRLIKAEDTTGSEPVQLSEILDALAAVPAPAMQYGNVVYGSASYVFQPEVTGDDPVSISEQVGPITTGPVGQAYGRGSYDFSLYAGAPNADITGNEGVLFGESTDKLQLILATATQYGTAKWGEGTYHNVPDPELTGADSTQISEDLDDLVLAAPVTDYGNARYGRSGWL